MIFLDKKYVNNIKTGKTPACFADHLRNLNIKPADISEFCDISPRSMRRYIKSNTAPKWIYAMAFVCAGFIPVQGFEGWQFTTDGLSKRGAYSTRNKPIKPHDLDNIHMIYSRFHSLERNINDLRLENEHLLNKLRVIDYRRAVPRNVIPFNSSTTYQDIYKQLQKGA